MQQVCIQPDARRRRHGELVSGASPHDVVEHILQEVRQGVGAATDERGCDPGWTWSKRPLRLGKPRLEGQSTKKLSVIVVQPFFFEVVPIEQQKSTVQTK